MKVLKLLFSSESIFFCFLFSGAVKIYLPNLPIDFTAITLILTLVVIFIRVVSSPKIPKKTSAAIVLFIILTDFLLISLIYSSSQTYAFDKSLRFLLFTGTSFLGSFIILKDFKSTEKFLNAMLLVSFIVCFAACLDYSQASNLMGNTQIRTGGDNTLGLARLSGVGVIAVIAFKLLNKGTSKLLFFIIVTPMLFTLFFTGSRMPLIALVCIILFLIVASIRVRKGNLAIRKGTLSLLVMSVIGVVIVLLNINKNSPLFYTLKIRFENLFSNNSLVDASALERVRRFEVAFDMFKESPFIGKGIGAFSVEYAGIDEKSYPHNIILELMSELGIVGLIIFLILTLGAIYKAIKCINNGASPIQFSLIAITLFIFINAMTTGDLNDNRILFAFIAMMYMLPTYKSNIINLEPPSKIVNSV